MAWMGFRQMKQMETMVFILSKAYPDVPFNQIIDRFGGLLARKQEEFKRKRN